MALYGGFYYVSKLYKFDDNMAYVKGHKGASWAPKANYYIGVIYYQREDYPKAQEAFTQLLTDYPTCQHAAKGLVYWEGAAEYNHDWGSARTALDRYIEEYPDGEDIDLMKKRSEMLKYRHGQ